MAVGTEKQRIQQDLFLSKGDLCVAYAALNRICCRHYVSSKIKGEANILRMEVRDLLLKYNKLAGWKE